MNIFKRIHYNSPVILTFTLASFVALLSGQVTGGASTALLFSVYRAPLTDPLFYVRLVGHVLGHISMEHFFNNFVVILLIGPILEEKYGSRNILIMIVVTALITGLLNVMFFSSALLGASGVAFMFIIVGSLVNLQKGRIPLTFILIAVVFIGKEVLDAIYISDNVSRLTHIVGGICGACLGFFLNAGSESGRLETGETDLTEKERS